MPLPLIPVALIGIGAVTGTGGIGLIGKGAWDMKKASDQLEASKHEYKATRSEPEEHKGRVNNSLKDLGAKQQDALVRAVERMADFLRRHKRQVADSEKLLADGLEAAQTTVGLPPGLDLGSMEFVSGVIGATVAGAATRTGLTTAVTALGTASTGTAISALSGAAAANATMAFLGGGSLAAGGGGVALGATVLNLVTAGPALLVSGFVVAGKGEKELTRAREYHQQVLDSLGEMSLTGETFRVIEGRIAEIAALLEDLVVRAQAALDLLESERFDPTRHAGRFQQALTFAVAVRDVATTPLIDENGGPNPAVDTVRIRYRPMTNQETSND